MFEGHPSWRSILGFYVKGAVLTGVVAALVALFGRITDDDVNEGLVVIVILAGAGLTLLLGFVKRVATRYTITNRRLNVKHGIISRDVQETRLERVQDVSYSQSIWQRALRIGDVDFDTASDDPSGFVFAGVAGPAEVVDRVHAATHASAGAGLGDSGRP